MSAIGAVSSAITQAITTKPPQGPPPAPPPGVKGANDGDGADKAASASTPSSKLVNIST